MSSGCFWRGRSARPTATVCLPLRSARPCGEVTLADSPPEQPGSTRRGHQRHRAGASIAAARSAPAVRPGRSRSNGLGTRRGEAPRPTGGRMSLRPRDRSIFGLRDRSRVARGGAPRADGAYHARDQAAPEAGWEGRHLRVAAARRHQPLLPPASCSGRRRSSAEGSHVIAFRLRWQHCSAWGSRCGCTSSSFRGRGHRILRQRGLLPRRCRIVVEGPLPGRSGTRCSSACPRDLAAASSWSPSRGTRSG